MRPDESDESLPGAGGIQGRGRVRRGQKTQCDLVLEGADMDTKLSCKHSNIVQTKSHYPCCNKL